MGHSYIIPLTLSLVIVQEFPLNVSVCKKKANRNVLAMFSVSMVKHSDQKQLKEEVGHLALGSRGTEGAHHGGASVGRQQVLEAERAHFPIHRGSKQEWE